MKARGFTGMFSREVLFLALVCVAPCVGWAQFSFETNIDTLTVTGYSGPEVASVVITATTNGMPIVSIGQSAFAYRNITGITIPDGITTIADSAFYECLLVR